MAPPFHSGDDPTPSSHARGIYTFPLPSSSSSSTMAPPSGGGGANNANAPQNSNNNMTTATSTAGSMRLNDAKTGANSAFTKQQPQQQQQQQQQHFICSPIPAAAASFLLRRRLLLPTLAIPALILAIPPLVVSCLSLLAYNATASRDRGTLTSIIVTSTSILASTWLLSKLGRSAIERHAPNDLAKKNALAKSSVALPFWSLVASTGVVRALNYLLQLSGVVGGNVVAGAVARGGWMNWSWGLVTSTMFWAVKVAGACVGPALGWAVMSVLVVCRYAGPFFPIVRCSSTPLRTNPFDAILQRLGRNFTSKNRFLDMIADGLDKLSAPSTSPAGGKIRPGTQSTNGTNQMKPTAFTSGIPPGLNAKAASAAKQQILQPNSNDGFGRLLKFLVASSNARYSRPGLLSILVQVLVNAVGGHVFTQTFIIPHLGLLGNSLLRLDNLEDTAVRIIWLSSLMVPVFELFSSINEAELHHSHYSSVTGSAVGSRGFRAQPVLAALLSDVLHRVKRSIFGITMLSPIIASGAILLLSHLGPLLLSDSAFMLELPSYLAVLQSLLVSYLTAALLVSIMAVQDVLTRWAVCAPGMDADVLMFETPSPTTLGKPRDKESSTKFLAEDLFVQSVLMGDGLTVEKVITAPGTKSLLKYMAPITNPQKDEIARNDIASASFAHWIHHSSTTSSGKLSDDILRMCLLESLGGGGSASSNPTTTPFYFGHAGHSAAVRKRLDLSAATASPGQQPIAAPIIRALCAFAGGVGDAMSHFYRQHLDKNGKPLPLRKDHSAELWKLPPGSFNAMEYAIIAAARLVVMNFVIIDKQGRIVVNASKRDERLSLMLPCALQSAYKLRSGLHEYARATANMYEVNLSTYDKTNGTKSDGGLKDFIAAKCPDISPIISACNDSAKMVKKAIDESGHRCLEDLLSTGKLNNDMQQWLIGL